MEKCSVTELVQLGVVTVENNKIAKIHQDFRVFHSGRWLQMDVYGKKVTDQHDKEVEVTTQSNDMCLLVYTSLIPRLPFTANGC